MTEIQSNDALWTRPGRARPEPVAGSPLMGAPAITSWRPSRPASAPNHDPMRLEPRLHGLLEASAERRPDHAAFLRDGAVTTYAGLARAVARFAASLRRLGVRAGDRVALVLDGVVEYLIAYYGTIQSGAVVVPLCPDTRTEVLVRSLAHAGAASVVIEGQSLHYVAGQGSNLPDLRSVIVLGEGEGERGDPWELVPFQRMIEGPEELHDDAARGDALAAINYTSGTTGHPKGVMLTHRNLVTNILAIVTYLQLGAEDVVGMVLPFFYVYGNSVLHTHLCAGGTIASLGSMAFPARVVQGLEAFRCTGFSGVPCTFARLLSYSGLREHDLSSLRYVTQAGAAMPQTTIERLRAALPKTRLFVMYGQTEASARLAYLPPEDLDRKPGSAGRAIPGVSLTIMDAFGNEVPRGTVGEIVARGESITRGYWRDPEETRRVLRPEGLRTGDLAAMDDEGYVYIAGRCSEMIKTGAHRVAPREVEDVIMRLDDVAECAVVGMPNDLLGQAIVAFVVRRPGGALTERDVLRECLLALPRFKVPSRVCFADSLPRTQTGKLRRHELRAGAETS